MLLRDFVNLDYMKSVCVVFEIITICLVNNHSLEVLVAFIVLTAAVQFLTKFSCSCLPIKELVWTELYRKPRLKQPVSTMTPSWLWVALLRYS